MDKDAIPTREAYETNMEHPSGVVCDDCSHFVRCRSFGFTWSMRRSCDFYPNRFAARAELDAAGGK